MENLSKRMSVIEAQEFKVSNGKLNQVERNTMKSEILAAIGLDLPEGTVIGKCKEGLIVEVPNDNEGSITFILDIKIKPLDFDGLHIIESYNQDKAEKAERAASRKRDQAATYRNGVRLREMKAEREAKRAK